jgi:hypothetical protein
MSAKGNIRRKDERNIKSLIAAVLENVNFSTPFISHCTLPLTADLFMKTIKIVPFRTHAVYTVSLPSLYILLIFYFLQLMLTQSHSVYLIIVVPYKTNNKKIGECSNTVSCLCFVPIEKGRGQCECLSSLKVYKLSEGVHCTLQTKQSNGVSTEICNKMYKTR